MVHSITTTTNGVKEVSPADQQDDTWEYVINQNADVLDSFITTTDAALAGAAELIQTNWIATEVDLASIKNEIPTETSQLTNNSDYTTNAYVNSQIAITQNMIWQSEGMIYLGSTLDELTLYPSGQDYGGWTAIDANGNNSPTATINIIYNAGNVYVDQPLNVAQLYTTNNGDLFGSLDVSGLINLNYVDCDSNQLTSLDVSGLINLNTLYCYSNQLTSLDASGLINLNTLYCYSNQLTSLDVSGLINLNYLYGDSNQLTSLDVSGLINLHILYCGYNQLTSLDVSGLINLHTLYCYSNQLTSLDVSGLINLHTLYCGSNQLTSLDVSGLTGLGSYAYCDLSVNKLPSSAVDTIIIAIASIANAHNYRYGTCNIQGQTPAAPPTSASSAALATLAGLNWTVNHD